jgi:hypothetical protein
VTIQLEPAGLAVKHDMQKTVKRELRVAFSKRAQSPLFRLIKWVAISGGTALVFRTSFFWYWVIGLPFFGLTIHFVYRWQTHGWTRPWGGWSDVEAGH